MKKFLQPLAISLALLGALLAAPIGCKHPSLELGGAYAATNTVPDYAFFVADSAFDLAYSTIDAAFKFERDNRALLWKISPDIKHTLDQIRPQASVVTTQYLTVRAAYMANPVPANLTTLQTVLAKMQQLATAATAALPKAK